MKFNITNRQFLSAAIIVFYLIPLLFFSGYSIRFMSYHKSWTLLSLGLLLIVLGSLSLIFLLSYWEQSVKDRNLSNSLMSLQGENLSLKTREAKVALLDPSQTIDTPPLFPSVEGSTGVKESAREINILQAALSSNQKQLEDLVKSLELKEQELRKIEEEMKLAQAKAVQVAQDFADYKLFSEEQLKQKQLQLTALQQLVEDQRNEMEKRQDQIHQLDTKIHDLSYEIKTLLYLHDEEKPAPSKHVSPRSTKEEKLPLPLPQDDLQEFDEDRITSASRAAMLSEKLDKDAAVQTTGEALLLLRKCVQIAQKLTGANYHMSESSRYRTFSSSFFAIDQRRLFESLRNENGALIIVYSSKENKVLFANNETKSLLGWSPEKFLSDFSLIMQEGMQEWKKALQLLSKSTESQARLLAKTRQGQEIIMNCHLGVIPSGLFRNSIIGVLYPA